MNTDNILSMKCGVCGKDNYDYKPVKFNGYEGIEFETCKFCGAQGGCRVSPSTNETRSFWSEAIPALTQEIEESESGSLIAQTTDSDPVA